MNRSFWRSLGLAGVVACCAGTVTARRCAGQTGDAVKLDPDTCVREFDSARSKRPLEVGFIVANMQWPDDPSHFALGPRISAHRFTDPTSNESLRWPDELEFSVLFQPTSDGDLAMRRETRYRLAVLWHLGSPWTWISTGVSAAAHSYTWYGDGPSDVLTGGYIVGLAHRFNPKGSLFGNAPLWVRRTASDLIVRGTVDAQHLPHRSILRLDGRPSSELSLSYRLGPYAACLLQ